MPLYPSSENSPAIPGFRPRVAAIVKCQQVFYVLDSLYRLLWIGGDWDDFAAENLGGAARASRVLGTNLMDHVAGTEAQEVMADILNDVQETKRSFRMEYRCDSPEQRRDMRMTVTPMRHDRLMVTHDLRDARSLPAVGPGWRWEKGAWDCKCSFCGFLRRTDGWVDPFETGLRHPEVVDYGVCPTCRQVIAKELERIRKAGRAG